ncbi:ZP domain-containing protein-like [Pempheris klunzingeri]|uniref:ZP domain-containing protein-like n=1 Tax=Pempheris klunzingeri TaxID=3127111 RepID=UPI00397EE60B
MRVEVKNSSFSGHRIDHLRLSDPSTACSLKRNSDSTYVIADVPLNACGTQMEEDNENLIFKNEITTVDNSRDLITRKHLVEVKFKCQYSKHGNVSLGFIAHRENITVWEKGLGTFTYQFEFYPDDKFRTKIDPSSYPLEYDVGSRIYMKIKASSQLSTTDLSVESCRAAPYNNPNNLPTYSIIEDGCAVDSTVQIHSSHQKQFKFSMEAFKFIGLHDQVYINCLVLMCEAGAPKERCSQRCINSPRSGGRLGKREAVTQTARHLISQGPLRLRRSAERTESPVVNVDLNLVFIAGCLLAAVGMICGVVVYKTRVSRLDLYELKEEV